MAAEYDFQRKPNPKGDGELQPMYPRIVNKGTITGKRLVSDISQATSFTPGDVEGVLAALESRISYYLSEGHHVQLGNMGHFSAGLTAPASGTVRISAVRNVTADYARFWMQILSLRARITAELRDF